MGTRHLIAVYDREGELRIAQYGQWDGYPSGNGMDVLEFLRSYKGQNSLPEHHLQNCRFVDEGEEISLTRSPQFSRDVSAAILSLACCGPGLELKNNIEFAADGLFCEWAYVIDYQKGVFEVYKGFSKTTCKGRFKDMNKASEEYRPVTLIAVWPLTDLPDDEAFLALESEDFDPDTVDVPDEPTAAQAELLATPGFGSF